MGYTLISVMALLVSSHPLWCNMVYVIIALIAWNLIITYRLWQEHMKVKAIDDGCRKMFQSIVKAVNTQSKIINMMLEEPDSKRIH